MLDHKVVEKVDRPDDPRRCQGVVPTGQCNNLKVEGSNYCLAHGGASTIKKQEAESLYRFRVDKYRNRINEIAKSSNIKSLREEIGVLRMLLEERMNSIGDDLGQLMLNSGELSEMVVKIDKLVNSCHNLESKLGVMIDKTTLLNLTEQIVKIIGDEIKSLEQSDEILDRISSQILSVMNEQVGEDQAAN